MMRDQQEEEIKKIFSAAERGDLEKVKKFIESGGVSPRICRGFGFKEETIAHVAAKGGHLNLLKYLVETYSSFLKNDSDGYLLVGGYAPDHRTILETAVAYGHLEIVKYLVENHHSDIFQRRLANRSAKYYRTPISLAISRGHLNILKYFIEERRVNVDTGKPNETPLHLSGFEPLLFRAVRFKRQDIVKYLIEEKNANLFMLDKNKQNILYQAVRETDLNFIKYVLDEKKAKIDINWRDKEGKTLVHVAVFEKCLDILQYLVAEKKADMNVAESKIQRTPLHWAISRQNYDVFKFLVDHGADLEKKDEDGKTPLHLAVQSDEGEKCKYLLKYGVNMNVKSNDGETPLDIAIARNRPVAAKYLIGHMDDVDERNDKGETLVHKVASLNNIELLDFLVNKRHAKVNVAREEDLWTPLHCAAFWNHQAICRYLIKHGADPRAQDTAGKSPAQVACNKEVIHYIQNASAAMETRSRRSVSDSSMWIPDAPGPEPREYKFDRIDGDLRGRVTLSFDKTPAFHFDSFLLITNFLIRYLFLSNFTTRVEERELSTKEEEILQNRMDHVAEDAIRTFLDVDEHDEKYN